MNIRGIPFEKPTKPRHRASRFGPSIPRDYAARPPQTIPEGGAILTFAMLAGLALFIGGVLFGAFFIE